MRIALIDNGSLEPAAHENLRQVAGALSARCAVPVDAVSWRHSDRIPASALRDGPAATLGTWVRAQVAQGERELLVVPFFISAQGAIGSSLREDLVLLQATDGPFEFAFTQGLSDGPALAEIVASRIREAAGGLAHASTILVDHGGPSPASAALRNRVADAARALLGEAVLAASMESPEGERFAFNRPLLREALATPGFDAGDVVIAPLFLSPGKHAGPGGDLERIALQAQADRPALRCRFAGLVGTHPAAVDFLAGALSRALNVGAHP